MVYWCDSGHNQHNNHICSNFGVLAGEAIMALYPYPNTVTGLSGVFQYINQILGNDLIGPVLLFLITIVALINLLRWGISKAAASASVIALLTSLLLRYAGLISDLYVVACTIFVVVAALNLYARG